MTGMFDHGVYCLSGSIAFTSTSRSSLCRRIIFNGNKEGGDYPRQPDRIIGTFESLKVSV